MTNIELETMTAIKAACREITNKQIDWEQRRYEIARDIACARFSKDCGSFTDDQVAPFAVKYADALIAELKK